MAELPIMPLKIDALAADTTHMTAEEFGAYTRILMALWRHGGRLPHDDKSLRRITGVHPGRWPHIRNVVLRPLTIADGLVSQKRLTATMLDVREYRASRKAGSIAGVAARQRNVALRNGAYDAIVQFRKPLK